MLENIVYALPELFLICGLFCLPIMSFFKAQPRKIIKTSILIILASAFMEIVFYNKSFAPHYLNDNAFNTMINMVVYVGSLVVMFLARRWYLAVGESPFVFCESLLLTILFGNVMTASTHFAVTLIAYWGMLAVNFMILHHSAAMRENNAMTGNFALTSLFFGSLMLLIAFVFYFENGHLSYASLSSFFAMNAGSADVSYLMFAVFLCFAFAVGLAPFCFWRTELLGQAILPVISYFLLVPFGISLIALTNLSRTVFAYSSGIAENLFLLFGLLSVLFGAVGSCSGKNVYKLLAYASLFHLGIMLISLSSQNIRAVENFMLYSVTYLVAMFGVISALYGLKSRGEYLSNLSDIAGTASKKPYISALIAVFLFYLIGFPPFLGFAGLYAIFFELVAHNHLYILMFLLVNTAIITYGYMQIIKSLYFEKSKNVFDATERGIYIFMTLNTVFMALLSMKPDILIVILKEVSEKIVD